ncbi:hypothetical protein A2118_01160 [Candidatus Kaiserbacteria bacterium GWA2_50_9]|uniref:methylated-DNA--[protein]-cysteine S-methyltransferase n=1 Tax=Candidatus Kaiserbacteria bacterium GWA2_50_9 TaxID=1798474 RepID=A0A1F6BSP1_9BACT|nr:MAG: hypothetical protein A2118_01160 [Candidatus Kaiserbacteria bacterium GWA2_50_9]
MLGCITFIKNVKKNSFAERVRDAVRQIPRGETRSYREVARAIGHPGAARAVGTVMKNNHDLSVPCHRVIRANGEIGGFNRGGSEAKKKLLKLESAI